MVSYDEPHDPSLCPPPYNTMYSDYHARRRPSLYDTLEGKPEYQRLWAGHRLELDRDKVSPDSPLLMGCNSFVDSEIGRVLDKARSATPDAMRMFTSDHGDAMNAHCLYAKGPAVYDEIARIPLIFAGPEARAWCTRIPYRTSTCPRRSWTTSARAYPDASRAKA